MKFKRILSSGLIVFGAAVIGTLLVAQTIYANSVPSQVTVGAATPVISAVSVNGGGSITLTANATTNINVTATVTDANGCNEITTGTTTVLLYRTGYSSSTCMTTANNLDCYQATAFTASSTCSGGSQTATTTFALQYFAQATDASSSFPSDSWRATVVFRTPDAATGTADSPGVTLNTLTAINITTSSVNYGAITANANTGAIDQVTTTTNAGNSSTSLQLAASATLTSGANVIATSSQGYSTSIFSYPGTSTALTGSAVTVNGFLLTSPTTTTNVASPVYWGLGVPNGTPTGTYTGTNLFQALFHS